MKAKIETHLERLLVALGIVAVCLALVVVVCFIVVEPADGVTNKSAVMTKGKIGVYDFHYKGTPCLILAHITHAGDIPYPVHMTCNWGNDHGND